MRVLHVITSLSGGGAERFVSSLVPQLARNVGRCAVMTIYPDDIPPAVAGASNLDILEASRRGRYDAAFLPRMIAQMRAWRPDVVHAHMHGGTYWGRVAALASGVPAIVRTEHHPCDTTRMPGTAIADRLLNAATSAVVTFFEEQSRFLAEYEGFAPRKRSVIPNGIVHGPVPQAADAVRARHSLNINPDAYAIFVVGSLYRPKNPALAVEAYRALDRQYRERALLFFIGDGVDRARLTGLVHEYGLQERVRFLGHRNDVADLLPGADLLLMPSISEGMPLALLEAMSAGVPVLSTPWRGVSDMLRHGDLGAISTGYEPATMAAHLAELIDDPTPAKAAARRAQAVARNEYAISLTAERHVELYELLLAQRRAA